MVSVVRGIVVCLPRNSLRSGVSVMALLSFQTRFLAFVGAVFTVFVSPATGLFTSIFLCLFRRLSPFLFTYLFARGRGTVNTLFLVLSARPSEALKMTFCILELIITNLSANCLNESSFSFVGADISVTLTWNG
ncbi:hypothetical protein AX774_g7394 [Zancudomyces culisetae]|uniref:Uncharacterized protein n=1 Tax=Zancudomyces culisetae TaxID=1213189 RepID=A0A1R1PEA3_ZANCU|nr:hypothetical protein AX774_g7394 [Zancudomyces culisetae]|eukprot:OMH79202.1 hypothetical protein AX774_g7394 [Zancudomyces culisetae]